MRRNEIIVGKRYKVYGMAVSSVLVVGEVKKDAYSGRYRFAIEFERHGQTQKSTLPAKNFIREWNDEDESEETKQREGREEAEAMKNELLKEGFSAEVLSYYSAYSDGLSITFSGGDAYLLIEKLNLKRKERENGV